MVIRASLITGLAIAAVSAVPAFAQSTTTIVREAVPAQKQTIIANSPEDLALQEEIRKIRAYNAYVDSQVGITGQVTETAPATIAKPAATNAYSGAKIELFETSTTQAPATTIIERQPVAGATSIYRVVEGDTLYSLSKRNCLEVKDIQDQNGLSGSGIKLGQVLTIPASKCGTATSSISANTGTVRTVIPAQTSTIVNPSSYAVLPKDSLYAIGKRYCVSAADIATKNGIATTSVIKPGQILQLPASACIK